MHSFIHTIHRTYSQLYSLSRCLYVPLVKHLSVCSFQPVYKPDRSLTAAPLQPPENHTSATNADKHKTVITTSTPWAVGLSWLENTFLRQAILTRKVGQVGVVFGLRRGFISSYLYTQDYKFMRACGYDS